MVGHTYLRTHDLTAEHLSLNLGAAMAALRADEPDGQDRSGVTLVRQSGLSVVLTHLRAGASLEEHAVSGAVTVQVLDGHARIRVNDDTVDAVSGQLVAFDANVRHAVEATEDCTLLITLAQPRT